MRAYALSGGIPSTHPPINRRRGLGLAAGGSGGVSFFDGNGNPINTIQCGQPYTFNVPGYSSIWLDQTHNGQSQYSGILPVPMSPYTANCTSEPGLYMASAYTVVGGQRGQLIGQTTLTVLGGNTAPVAAQPLTLAPAPGAAAPASTGTTSGGGSTSTTTTTTTTGGGGGETIATPVPIASGVSLTPGMLLGLGVLVLVFLAKD